MDIKNKGSAYKRVKGFTLVELIVVIAIIAVLAGTLNLATKGFIRNARLETANDKARLLFTGFQNILTQCEIKQDNTVISPKLESNAIVKDDTLKTIVIEFKCYDGNIQCCRVSGYDGTKIHTLENLYNANYSGGILKYSDGVTKGSSNLPNAIAGIIDATFDGEAKVYIDYENYEVRSVVYKQMDDANKNTTFNDFSDGDLKAYSKMYPKASGSLDGYLGFASGQSQDDAYKHHPLYGVYPYQEELGITG